MHTNSPVAAGLVFVGAILLGLLLFQDHFASAETETNSVANKADESQRRNAESAAVDVLRSDLEAAKSRKGL